ncbi:hypothetical protein EJ07DRAFT_180538 [Lizonia empirigonia]|nr:hypothetical protein EJ07DRAFT_180538 [Lizonia empirigonia]
MTPGIVRALSCVQDASPEEYAKLQSLPGPALADPKPGNPVSHSQLIDLSKLSKQLPTTTDPSDDPANPNNDPPTTLAALLRNTTLMLHPPATRETFQQRFPHSGIPSRFSTGEDEVDDVTYEEVHRQMILIINVLISIVCVAVFVWVAARHWGVGKRLGLAMGSAVAVGVAEVVVYSGYVRKVQEAKLAEKKKPEIKEIVASWVLHRNKHGEEAGLSTSKEKLDDGMRYRKGKHR